MSRTKHLEQTQRYRFGGFFTAHIAPQEDGWLIDRDEAVAAANRDIGELPPTKGTDDGTRTLETDSAKPPSE